MAIRDHLDDVEVGQRCHPSLRENKIVPTAHLLRDQIVAITRHRRFRIRSERLDLVNDIIRDVQLKSRERISTQIAIMAHSLLLRQDHIQNILQDESKQAIYTLHAVIIAQDPGGSASTDVFPKLGGCF